MSPHHSRNVDKSPLPSSCHGTFAAVVSKGDGDDKKTKAQSVKGGQPSSLGCGLSATSRGPIRQEQLTVVENEIDGKPVPPKSTKNKETSGGDEKRDIKENEWDARGARRRTEHGGTNQ